MNEMEESDKDLEAIRVKLNQLFATYTELKRTNNTEAHLETLKEGFLLNARKNTEKILKYICKREGIIVKPRSQNGIVDDGRIPMLNDYIFNLKGKKIIDVNIEHHLEIIKRWGNRNAHDISTENAEPEHIKSSTIESVYDSFHSFAEWFFKKYSNGPLVDFSKNEYSKIEPPKEYTEEEIAENRRNFKWEDFGVPDYSYLKHTKENKRYVRKQKRRVLFRFLFIISIISLVVYFFIKGIIGNEKESSAAKVQLKKEEVYDLLINYFNSSNKISNDAHEFFANRVDTFFFRYNLSPDEIDIIQQENTSYIDNKNEIEKESLVISSKNDSITRWRFWTKYTCYRPKLKKFQKNDRILMEFGITNYGKIKFVKQLAKTPEQYTIEKPN